MNRRLISFITISAIVCCIAMILGGAYLNNNILTYVGIGLLFGGSFLLAVVCVVVMFVRAKNRADEMDKTEQNVSDDEDDMNDSYTDAVNTFAHSIHGYRHSSRKGKALTILFLTLTLGSVFGGLIALFCKQRILAYVLFGCFALTIFIGIMSAVIASHKK